MEKLKVPVDSVIVMKFGGTSLRSEESRAHVIRHIRGYAESGKN